MTLVDVGLDPSTQALNNACTATQLPQLAQLDAIADAAWSAPWGAPTMEATNAPEAQIEGRGPPQRTRGVLPPPPPPERPPTAAIAALAVGEKPELAFPPPQDILPKEARLAAVLSEGARDKVDPCRTYDVVAYIDTPRLFDVGHCMREACATATRIPWEPWRDGCMGLRRSGHSWQVAVAREWVRQWAWAKDHFRRAQRAYLGVPCPP